MILEIYSRSFGSPLCGERGVVELIRRFGLGHFHHHKCGCLDSRMGCVHSKTSPKSEGLKHGQSRLPTLLSSSPDLHMKLSPLGSFGSKDGQNSDLVSASTHDLPPLEDLEAESAVSTSSSMETWELELLRVSLGLKRKLKDPHFVARRCDLDGSGDLDTHELGHAARAFGMKLSTERLQQLKGGECRVSKERFAEIVAEPRLEVEKIRPAIPHSLRGIALGQLQHLENLFIKSGWLAAQCEAFNTANAEAISKGKKFHQTTNLYALDSYVVSPMSKPGSCAAREHDLTEAVPQAEDKMSFSELLNPHGLIVHCFVSHFWGKIFSETVTALRSWAEGQFRRLDTACPKSVVFWICLFAVNQHAVADEVGDSPMQGPFNAAIAKAEGGAVMVLDEHINPFKRIWCLFEVSRLKELNQPFELICDLGSLSRPESLEHSLRADPAAAERILQATCEALWTVSAVNAKASMKKDKVQIWQEIANEGSRKVISGMRTFLLSSDELPDESQFWLTDFDRYIQSLLSTALLHFFLAHKQLKAAAKCCEHGACFTEEQFQEIYGQLAEERETWVNRLLNVNARDERLDTVHFLLALGADTDMRCHDSTALMRAATGGQEATTKVLLEHKADVAAADSGGTTALMRAALGGHVAVAKLLLEHKADVTATENDGTTSLMHSALAGHEAVVKLLLESGANVIRTETDGTTALMGAALGGHAAVVKLLLENGARVTAKEDDGTTALMKASLNGHTKVVQLLLKHGADVTALRDDGRAALTFAATGGHEEVVQLLLDHGADVEAADKNGDTPLSHAIRRGHNEIAELLKKYGAQTSVFAVFDLPSDTVLGCWAKVLAI